MLPDTKEVIFGDRPIYVTYLLLHGLAIFDPERQGSCKLPSRRFWIAYTNIEEDLLYPGRRIPSSIAQTSLAIRGYAAFLDRSYKRPGELGELPADVVTAQYRKYQSDYAFDQSCLPQDQQPD